MGNLGREQREARPLDPELDPWDRQPSETATAYERFLAYRDMGNPRSQRRLASTLGLTAGNISDLSVRWQWQARVAAFDREQDRLYLAELKSARRSAAQRHARQSEAHLRVAQETATEVLRRLRDKPDLLQAMTLEDLLLVQQAASRTLPRLVVAERLALGATTENIGEGATVDDDLLALTDEQLDAQLTGLDPDAPDDYLAGYNDGTKAGHPAPAD